MSIKRGLNRADFRADPVALRAGLLANDYREPAIEIRHCLALSALHANPFNRMLLSRAINKGLILLTADAALTEYGGPVERFDRPLN